MQSPGKRSAPPTAASTKVEKKMKTSGGERDEFLQSFKVISEGLFKELLSFNLPENGIEWFKNMFNETVPGGKVRVRVRVRGLKLGLGLGLGLVNDGC